MKKLVSLLLTMLLIFSLLPITVFAVAKITLKSGAAVPATVYAGHTYNLKINTSAKVQFYSNNKKVAIIGATTGKMKTVAPGTVKITAKDAKSGKTVATHSFTVLQRAQSVTTDSAELYLGAPGDTATIKAALSPVTSTDVVRFTSSDKTVATVGLTSGNVTAVKEGECIINVYAKATKATANSNKDNKVTTVKVYVGPIIDSVKQISMNKLEVTYKSDIQNVKASDFTLINDTTSATFPIKSADISTSDGKKAVITAYSELKDGQSYTVTFADSSAKFTATDGKTDFIRIEPTIIPCDTPTVVYVAAYDRNGVEVERHTLTDHPSFDFTIDFWNNDMGYLDGDKVIFTQNGAGATAQARMHTYKYDNNVEVGVLSAATALRSPTVDISSDGIRYTVTDSAPDFLSPEYKQNTSITVNETGKAVYFNITDTNGQELSAAEYASLRFSSDNNRITVSEAIDITAGNKLNIEANEAGEAFISVKDTNGAVLCTLPLTVLAPEVVYDDDGDIDDIDEIDDSDDINSSFIREWDETLKEDDCSYIYFTTEKAGTYVFEASADNDGYLVAELYDEFEEQFYASDEGNYVCFFADLSADTTYLLVVTENEGLPESFHLKVYMNDDMTQTASVLSGGNLAIITAVAGIAVGFLAAMFIFRKKKPVTADGVEKENEDNE